MHDPHQRDPKYRRQTARSINHARSGRSDRLPVGRILRDPLIRSRTFMNDKPEPEPDQPEPQQPAAEKSGRMARLLDYVRALAGLTTNGSARSELEQALEADEGRGAAFAPEERAMLRAVLKLGDLRVDDIMVPRASIDAVDAEISVGDLLGAFRKAGHSRMPVYRETLDDPIGMAHIKDVMAWIADTADRADNPEGRNTPFDLSAVDLQQTLTAANIVRPILFVPPSMPVRMLLERMQASRTQMALVIDEYGGTDGLVSLEDLVETIFGEIEDEHDIEEEFTIRETADGQFVADARVSVEDACEVLGPSFNANGDTDIDTIGGLIYAASAGSRYRAKSFMWSTGSRSRFWMPIRAGSARSASVNGASRKRRFATRVKSPGDGADGGRRHPQARARSDTISAGRSRRYRTPTQGRQDLRHLATGSVTCCHRLGAKTGGSATGT